MLTPYQTEKNEVIYFDWDVLSWDHDRKNRKKEELIFKTNALVPKTAVIRNEEGATAASPRSLFYRKDP